MATPVAPPTVPAPIFIHGSGGNHRVWARQSARFPGAALVDLPGHTAGEPLRDIDELAVVVAHAVALSGRRAVLVGHSLGGAIAAQVALQRPDLVAGLVLVATGARLPIPDWVWESLAEDFAGECARLMRGFLSAPDDCDLPIEETLLACGPATLAADYSACSSVDLSTRLAALDLPTVVVVGGDDPFTPPWMGRELAAAIPGAQLVEIAGVRHLPMVEAADRVNQVIAAVAARCEGPVAA